MKEFDWIKDYIAPELSEDGIELLKIIGKFDTFPSNLMNARHKRFNTLNGYMLDILELNIKNVFVADIANTWLTRLNYLINVGQEYGKVKLYQKSIRKIIREMKKDKEKYATKMAHPDEYWFSYTADEILHPWKQQLHRKVLSNT